MADAGVLPAGAVAAPRRVRTAGGAARCWAPATLAVAVMLLLPLLLLLRFSLNQYDPKELMIEAATAANYLRFMSDPFYRGVLRTTLGVAAASTALCLVLGLPLAYRLARMPGGGSRWPCWPWCCRCSSAAPCGWWGG